MSGKQPDGYTVKQILESCTHCTQESALLMCTESECKHLCYHMYKCDEYCYDYTNGHLCKHIHRVHSFRLKAQTCEPDSDYHCDSKPDHHELPENDDSDIDDPFEFAENVWNHSTGM